MRRGPVPRYETWVERKIREAMERGEFDDLPGQGQPLPDLNGRDDENWWVKKFLEREDLKVPLPTSLALRKEVRDLPERLAQERHEQCVRLVVEELNDRIRDSHRRRVDGPPVVTGVVDVEAAVAQWSEGRKGRETRTR